MPTRSRQKKRGHQVWDTALPDTDAARTGLETTAALSADGEEIVIAEDALPIELDPWPTDDESVSAEDVLPSEFELWTNETKDEIVIAEDALPVELGTWLTDDEIVEAKDVWPVEPSPWPADEEIVVAEDTLPLAFESIRQGAP